MSSIRTYIRKREFESNIYKYSFFSGKNQTKQNIVDNKNINNICYNPIPYRYNEKDKFQKFKFKMHTELANTW